MVDRATLQLVGLLFSSILLPGLARVVMTQQQKNWQRCCSKVNKECRNALMNIVSFQERWRVEQRHPKKMEALPSQCNARGMWPFASKFRTASKSPINGSSSAILTLVSRSD
eukprot:3946782-Amphidinium_carterae.1